jgi:hypothetical protein
MNQIHSWSLSIAGHEEMTMDDADLLRNRATRLFALAEQVRQQGHIDHAEELDKLAREVVRHAVIIEGRFHTQAA